jgi:hypothetical protein
MRQAQKAAIAASEVQKAPTASITKVIQQPDSSLRPQVSATINNAHSLEDDSTIPDPVGDIAQPKALPKLGRKVQQRSERAKKRVEATSNTALSIVRPSDTAITSPETVVPKATPTEAEASVQPLKADATAQMKGEPQLKKQPHVTRGRRAKQRRAQAAVDAADPAVTASDNAKTVATLETVTSEPASSKIPSSNQTASKRASVEPLAPRQPRNRVPVSRTAWMLRDTGTLVCTIAATSLEPDSTKVSSEGAFKTLCSYNWQNDGAIFVPGGPPKWTPPPLPVTLPQDTGRHFMDQNAHRVPKHPFEPAFQALSIMKPNMNLDTVDIVANRNSFRKLIDFAGGSRRDPWCMGLHLVNNTLFISRKERNATQMIHGAANSGYGHNFEKTFTKPEDDMENSSSHHRVIRYHIGPLECVVRFEVDAYYEDPDAVESDESIVDAMTQLKLQEEKAAQPTPRPNPTADKTTKATHKGTFIDPSKLAEIKAKRFDRLGEAMPQLWFGRTPWFLNGNHNNGKVHSVTIAHAKAEFPRWEQANQDRLRKMVSLLKELKKVVQGLEGRAAVLVCEEKGGDLRVYKMKRERDGGVLPKDIIERHWTVDNGEAK